MVTVVHAFPEEDEVGRDMHLRFWYGTVSPSDEAEEDWDMPVVCWCGGRRVDFSRSVCVVWHGRSWNDRGN